MPGFAGYIAWLLIHSHYQGNANEWEFNMLAYGVSGPLWSLAGGSIGARIRESRTLRQGRSEAQFGARGLQREMLQAMLPELMGNVAKIIGAALLSMLGQAPHR